MRKLTVLLSVVALIAALAACGSDSNDSSSESAAPATSAAAPASSEAAASTEAPASSEAVSSEAASSEATSEPASTEATSSEAASTEASAESSTEAPVIAGFETRTPDVLTVGIDLPNPTYVSGDSIDKLNGGFEYDLVNELAKRLGVSQVKWVLFPFNALVAGKSCPCDFSVGGVSIFPDRQKVVDFSSPYYTVNQAVLAKKGTEVPDLAAAKKLHFAAQRDSSGAYYLDTVLKPSTQPSVFPTLTNALLALAAGKVDAVIIDANIAADEAAKKPDLAVVGQFETDEEIGAVLKKGSPNTPILSQAIDQLKSEGFLDGLVQKYFAAQATAPVIK